MSFKEDLKRMPWFHISKVTFLKRELIIEFKSGNKMLANPPSKELYEEFLEACKKNLCSDQIELGDVE